MRHMLVQGVCWHRVCSDLVCLLDRLDLQVQSIVENHLPCNRAQAFRGYDSGSLRAMLVMLEVYTAPKLHGIKGFSFGFEFWIRTGSWQAVLCEHAWYPTAEFLEQALASNTRNPPSSAQYPPTQQFPTPAPPHISARYPLTAVPSHIAPLPLPCVRATHPPTVPIVAPSTDLCWPREGTP